MARRGRLRKQPYFLISPLWDRNPGHHDGGGPGEQILMHMHTNFYYTCIIIYMLFILCIYVCVYVYVYICVFIQIYEINHFYS